MDDLTVDDILKAHAEFGQLDRDLVREAMGENWPCMWEVSDMFV